MMLLFTDAILHVFFFYVFFNTDKMSIPIFLPE